MIATRLEIPEVIVFQPNIFGDDRGYFFESFNKLSFDEIVGQPVDFVQDNQSRSVKGVLRGLHYQLVRPQGKLVRVLDGEIFDVAVDLRRSSSTFGQWVGARISSEEQNQIWVPEGFAHGFVVLSEYAVVAYKTTDYWFPEHERSLKWDDPSIGINWPQTGEPLLSTKDQNASAFEQACTYP
ncbi:dTDP-4-dehydrorhamnose 3,5-epimerase [Pseudomonas plecoglossicida]|uniref:dTDP-4-dehydrorhamnose 3,5-epimerase n=1 Tax=Pseudomonas TaxID=286 RepID=UPI000760BFDC|nr:MULTISPECIES: dTDP-4-dehydrorhamnose 3,5-epimerase [Pseudomonas]MDN5520897.1 dTDP-4-dehydrorhamnose 3,5-epimerase [Pseudomonas sp.]MDQ7966994.1 dTDP-4-dehydrorhamnose 3,5-epimerase [Pseudomonas plecoglossicida]WBM45407.1 dTDP-4-dehydrorhamnose 3,5-epimerase [Pseudomonas putida]WFG01762.1 dTDP-4-dehydrorhamnose 3,5-epimerase [Pseudomonas putida]HDS0940196.1 dTDP-4-dehydrorhamnose 3,5-epimerase [Pseudomonas putida]